MSIRTYKYKLYKTKKDKRIHDVINISGIIYNHCIALHKKYYKLYGKHLNKFQLQKHLTKLKKRDKYAFWEKVPSQAIQDITVRIDNAYKKFFDYAKGKTKQKVSPPTFKAVRKYKSYTLKGKVGYKLEDNIGDFYICITQEIKDEKKHNITSGKSVDIGADFGLKTFLTLSDKTEIEAPLYHLKNLSKQKRLNRNLSKKQKDSNGRKKAKLQLANNYNNIFIEDLNMKAMQMMWGRKISDLAFSEFVNILEYKANVTKIDRFFPSSKTCSNCGYVLKELDLKTREWTCPSCQAKHQRDVNASINIKRVGASTLAGEVVRAISVA